MEMPKRPDVEPQPEFMHELVSAMMGVAEQAREEGIADLRTKVDERISHLHEQAEQRADELRKRAERDVAGIGEWAKTEEERIKAEAETRESARREQLEQQLAVAEKRAEREASDVRRRVADFERELDAFFAQLNEISDPSAFASAAKRMPRPPHISAVPSAASTEPADAPASELSTAVPTENAVAGGNGFSANGTVAEGAEDHLSATEGEPAEAATLAKAEEEASTIVVRGLSSFGAITAFKQRLEGVDGIDGVTLTLGPTGEFVYRATHGASFDMEGAIRGLEPGNASVDRQPNGTLFVTLGRGR